MNKNIYLHNIETNMFVKMEEKYIIILIFYLRYFLLGPSKYEID